MVRLFGHGGEEGVDCGCRGAVPGDDDQAAPHGRVGYVADRQGGVRGRERRKVVDQAAAAVLLQAVLDGERATGRPPGEIVRGGS